MPQNDRQPARMNMQELPITGYLDCFSHRPGETFTAFVSLREPGPYHVRLVRVLSGDPNPDGPGLRFENLSQRFDRTFQGRNQPIRLGSYGIVRNGPALDSATACTWTVLVRPGLTQGEQVVFAQEGANSCVKLMITDSGATARLECGDKRV